MRGADLINAALPDELLDDVIRRVGAGGGGAKRDLDACALVCRRWRRLERASRRSARLAASGDRADEVLRLVAERFTALAEVSVDERLTAASGSGSATRSYRSGMERGPYRAGMVRLASPSLDPSAGIRTLDENVASCVGVLFWEKHGECRGPVEEFVAPTPLRKLGFRLLWNF